MDDRNDRGAPGRRFAVVRPAYLKLGGALLTEKDRRESVRPDVLGRLASEIARWPGATRGELVLAHGGGSYAHAAVTDSGFLAHPSDPLSIARVAAAARRLDDLVIDALQAAGVAAVAVPGSVLAVCRDGRVVGVRGDIVRGALRSGLVPVVYGDAAPDETRGGAIASTEPLLAALVEHVPPRTIVLATDVDGVYAPRPDGLPGFDDATPMPRITPRDRAVVLAQLGGARPGALDVTGGMAAKVAAMLEVVERHPGLHVRILSGLRPGAVLSALDDREDAAGTIIAAD